MWCLLWRLWLIEWIFVYQVATKSCRLRPFLSRRHFFYNKKTTKTYISSDNDCVVNMIWTHADVNLHCTIQDRNVTRQMAIKISKPTNWGLCKTRRDWTTAAPFGPHFLGQGANFSQDRKRSRGLLKFPELNTFEIGSAITEKWGLDDDWKWRIPLLAPIFKVNQPKCLITCTTRNEALESHIPKQSNFQNWFGVSVEQITALKWP